MSSSTAANGNHDDASAFDPTPSFVDKENTSHAPKETAELLRSDAGDIKAESVSMDRSGAETITAGRVSMDRSGTRVLEAKSAHFENSGAVKMHAENAVFYGGAAVAVVANQVKLVDSHVVAMKAADQTTIDGTVYTAIYAGPADAKIKPLFTASGAAAFGAGFAAFLLLFGRVLRWLARRG